MNRELGLRNLSQIMDWDDDEARTEFRWLSFMSQYKYDSYGDYLAGVRFIESLAKWLQQFKFEDRKVAYSYVKENLIYVSASEIQILVNKFYHEVVFKDLLNNVSKIKSIPKYLALSKEEFVEEFNWQKRKILFMGLSDGARLDSFRRANIDVVSNEQIVVATQVDSGKWKDLLKDLRTDLKKIRDVDCSQENFTCVYLIDDFTASGTSVLRPSVEKGEYKGKIHRFKNSVDEARARLKNEMIFDDGWTLNIHHYIGTEKAKNSINKRLSDAFSGEEAGWTSNINLTFGTMLQDSCCLDPKSGGAFVEICKKYYDSSIENDHSAESGDSNMTFGYGNCALPLVLEHNTPNNSLPVLPQLEMESDPC